MKEVIEADIRRLKGNLRVALDYICECIDAQNVTHENMACLRSILHIAFEKVVGLECFLLYKEIEKEDIGF